MKRYVKGLLVIFVFLAGFLTLTGCGKKTGNSGIDSQVIGTWESESEGIKTTYVLNEDGTGTYTIAFGDQADEKKLTYKTENNKLLITFEGDTDVYESEYQLKDGNLIIKDSFDTETEFQKK